MSAEETAFAIRCHYRAGGAEDRLPIRIAHLEFMIAALPVTVFGGALLADDGRPVGMEVIIRAPDRAAAERFIAAEPYHRADLFASVAIERVRPMTPPYDGSPLRAELAKELRQRAS